MRLTLKTSLIAIVSLLVLLLVCQGWLAGTQVQAINARTDDIATNWLPSVKALGEMKYYVSRLRTDGARLAVAVTPDEKAKGRQQLAEHQAAFEKLEKSYEDNLISGDAERRLWNDFTTKWSVYFDHQQKLLEALQPNAAELFGENLTKDYFLATTALDAGIAFNSKGAAKSTDDAHTTYAEAKTATLAMAAVAIGIGVLAMIFVVWRITRPLQHLNEAMGEMAAGNIDIKIPGAERRDEIGDMATTIGVIRDNAAREALAKQEAAQREEIQRAEQRKADMHRLANSFEAAVSEIIETVSSASTELEAAAGSLTQTAQATQQLSVAVASASEQASSNVQSVASATGEMAASVSEIGRQVESSTRIAQEAVKQAAKTDERIGLLTKAAMRIGDVSELIQAIAGQTNLLALNATIEAARGRSRPRLRSCGGGSEGTGGADGESHPRDF